MESAIRTVMTMITVAFGQDVAPRLVRFAEGKSKPNIIVILADDMGIDSINSLNDKNRIHTPYLYNLMTERMSFTDTHSGSSVCTPTRYGLLAGRYAW